MMHLNSEDEKMTRKPIIARIEHVTFHGAARSDTEISVDWIDTNNERGTTWGPQTSTHMQALVARARREGILPK
jgi:hypothetical protein